MCSLAEKFLALFRERPGPSVAFQNLVLQNANIRFGDQTVKGICGRHDRGAAASLASLEALVNFPNLVLLKSGFSAVFQNLVMQNAITCFG